MSAHLRSETYISKHANCTRIRAVQVRSTGQGCMYNERFVSVYAGSYGHVTASKLCIYQVLYFIRNSSVTVRLYV